MLNRLLEASQTALHWASKCGRVESVELLQVLSLATVPEFTGLPRHRRSCSPSGHSAVAGAGAAGVSPNTQPRQQSPRRMCPVQQYKAGERYESNSAMRRCRSVARCQVPLRMQSRWRSTDILVAGQSEATLRGHKIPVPDNRSPHPVDQIRKVPHKTSSASN